MKPTQHTDRRTLYAVLNWIGFFLVAVAINGTIPFLLGKDMHAWTSSTLKSYLFSSLIYGMAFLLVPITILKGVQSFGAISFTIPILVALGAIALRPLSPWIPIVSIGCLVFLHFRHGLTEYGMRSSGPRGDTLAFVLLLLIRLVPTIIKFELPAGRLDEAIHRGLDRLLGNPASSVENLFYFGFLATQLSQRLNRWLVALLIGAMYTLHEMSNPEYWYSGMNFLFTFFGVSVTCIVYLWKKSVPSIWLADGVSRFLSTLWG